MKKTTLEDQAAELRRLASVSAKPVTAVAIDPSRTQAASLILLAQAVRIRGVAA